VFLRLICIQVRCYFCIKFLYVISFSLAPRRRAFDFAKSISLYVVSACSANLSVSYSSEIQYASKRQRLSFIIISSSCFLILNAATASSSLIVFSESRYCTLKFNIYSTDYLIVTTIAIVAAGFSKEEAPAELFSWQPFPVE